MRAKPLLLAGRVQRVSDTANRVLCLLLLRFNKAQLVSQFVFVKLMFDILRNSAGVLPCRIYIISFAPKLSVAVFILELTELLIDHCCAFPLQIPHETRYRHLGWYLHQHMHMIRAYFCFDYIDPFPLAKLPQYLTYRYLLFAIKYFPTVFRCKHYMVFAIPF